jgi:hypothetical protein
MTEQEFFDVLSRVDWLYSMSDAPGVWDRGRKRVAEVEAQAEQLGPMCVRMCSDFSAYYSGIVTGETTKRPEISDYLTVESEDQ